MLGRRAQIIITKKMFYKNCFTDQTTGRNIEYKKKEAHYLFAFAVLLPDDDFFFLQLYITSHGVMLRDLFCSYSTYIYLFVYLYRII